MANRSNLDVDTRKDFDERWLLLEVPHAPRPTAGQLIDFAGLGGGYRSMKHAGLRMCVIW